MTTDTEVGTIDPVLILKDGAVVAVTANYTEALGWLHRHSSQSAAWAIKHEGYRTERPKVWGDKDARHHAATARNCLYGDAYHNSGQCAREGQLTQENCGQCVLCGYEPPGGYEDHTVANDGPNYAGWARIYVEAKRLIPSTWRDAFVRSLRTPDNLGYAEALARSVVTFGVEFTYSDD